MATRRELVDVQVDSNITPTFLRDAASAQLLARELDNLGRRTSVFDRAVGQLSGRTMSNFNSSYGRSSAQVDQFGRSLDQTRNRLDSTSGRMGILVDLLGSLGPSLVPIGGALVPMLAGVASGLGAAALAAAGAVVAFRGVGDAMGAINKFRDDPTAANLAAARAELEKMAPAARDFVVQLDSMRGLGADLVNAGASGLFPGLIESLEFLEQRGPEAEAVLRNINFALGNLASGGAESLAGGEWDEFFNFLATDVPDYLSKMGEAAGHAGKGMAELWMAMDPASDGFLDGLVSAAEGFSDWASSLSETQGFQDFLSYLQQTGPEVAALVGDIALAFAAIIEAAAPVGQATLPILQALSSALKVVAESDVATPILAAVAAWRAYAIAQRVATSGAMTGIRTWSTGLNSSLRSNIQSINLANRGLANTNSVFTNMARTNPGQAWGQIGRQAGTAAAAIGGLALVSSGAADKMNLTSTATLGMVGAMSGLKAGGPIGLAIGALMDLKGAVDDFGSAAEASQAKLDSWDLGAIMEKANLDKVNELSSYAELMDATSNGLSEGAQQLGYSFGELGAQAAQGASQAAILDDVMGSLSTSMGAGLSGSLSAGTADLAQWNGLLARSKPAMDALGISMEDLAAAQQRQQQAAVAAALGNDAYAQQILAAGPTLGQLTGQINSYMAQMDGTEGRTRAAAEAIAALGDVSLTSAQRANQLKSALDALINPQLNVTRATDAWTTALRHLGDDLAKNKTLIGDSDAAIQNREAINTRIEGLKDLLVAQVDAGQENKVIPTMIREREALLDSAEALGMKRGELRKYLDQQNLVPNKIFSELELRGATEAAVELSRLKVQFQNLPTKWQTYVKTNGVPNSMKEIKGLEGDLGKLTKKERRVLLQLRSEVASGKAKDFQRLMSRIDRGKATPRINADTGAATRRVNRFERDFEGVGKKRAKPKIDPETKGADTKVKGVGKSVEKVDRQKAKPKIDADTKAALSGAKKVESALRGVDRMHPTPTIGINDNASGKISSIKAGIASIQSKTVTITTVHRSVGKKADGGLVEHFPRRGSMIRGAGGPRDDKIPTMLSNGEFVMKQAAVARYGQGFMESINAMRFADGGLVDANRGVPVSSGQSTFHRVGGAVEFTINTPWGKQFVEAEIREMARDEARGEYREAQEWERRQKGRWSD